MTASFEDQAWFMQTLVVLLLLLALGSVVAAAVVTDALAPRRLRPALQYVAEALGVDAPAPGSPRIEGSVHGLEVRIVGQLAHEDSPAALAVQIELGRRVPQGLRVRRRTRLDPSPPRLREPTFDTHVSVEGPEAQVEGLFDATVRAYVLDLIRYDGFKVTSRGVSFRVPELDREPEAALQAVLRGVALAWHLSRRPETVPAMLLDLATRDSTLGVRRRCTDLLLSRFRGSHEAMVGMGLLMGEGQPPELRMAAALAAAERDPRRARVFQGLLRAPTEEVRRVAAAELGMLRSGPGRVSLAPGATSEGRLSEAEEGRLALVAS